MFSEEIKERKIRTTIKRGRKQTEKENDCVVIIHFVPSVYLLFRQNGWRGWGRGWDYGFEVCSSYQEKRKCLLNALLAFCIYVLIWIDGFGLGLMHVMYIRRYSCALINLFNYPNHRTETVLFLMKPSSMHMKEVKPENAK